MATAGPNAPTSGANIAQGFATWSNPNSITADDASYATCAPASNTCNPLRGQFAFSIPAGATIDGITLTVKAKVSSGTHQFILYPINAGANPPATTFTTTETTFTSGGSTSTFSHTWTASEVNSLVASLEDLGPSFSGTVSVNYMTATIDYTPASGGPHMTQTRQAVMRAATR